MKPMFYTFPGDNLDTYGTVWTVSLDYLCFVPFARTIARAWGIEASPQTLERWLRFMVCAQYFDCLIDDQPNPERTDEAGKIYAELSMGIVRPDNDYPEWIGHDLLAVGRLFSNALASIGGQRQAEAANGVLVCAAQKAAATTVKQYSKVLVQEGHFVGQLVAGCMSDKERQAAGFKRFAQWFGLFVGAIIHCDSLVDFKRDYERGLTGVCPSERNRKLLRRRLWALGPRLFLHPKPCINLAKIATALVSLSPEVARLFPEPGTEEDTMQMWASIKKLAAASPG